MCLMQIFFLSLIENFMKKMPDKLHTQTPNTTDPKQNATKTQKNLNIEYVDFLL